MQSLRRTAFTGVSLCSRHIRVTSSVNALVTRTRRRYCSEIPRENCPISRFPIPDRSTLDADVQADFDEVEKKAGFVPNIYKVMSYRQEEFRAFMNYHDILMEKDKGTLTRAEKELIVVATSGANHCLYCVVSHGALHRIHSKNPHVADQVATCPATTKLTARERAIVNFAMKICHLETLEEADFTELQNQGLSQDDVWDVGSVAAFFAMSNRLAHLTSARPNEEFYTMARTPKNKSD